MPQCQFPVFCCFCVSKKLHRKYYQNWTKQKQNLLFFQNTSQSPKQRRMRPGPGHTLVWHGQALAHATRGWTPWSTSWRRPSAYIFPSMGKNLKDQSIFHETYCKPPLSLTRGREGPEALPGTLPERGITAGGLLHHHGRLRSDVYVVYLGLRVHRSR
jgi:hypothetical protein